MEFIEPMKAKTAENLDKYLDQPHWVAEEKYDGTRYLAYLEGPEIKIISRRGVDKTDRLPQLVSDLRRVAVENPLVTRGTILDGEVIAFGGFLETMSLVGSLGSRGVHQRVQYRYCVFDILRASGQWLLEKPLLQRRAVLERSFAQMKPKDYTTMELTEQWQPSYTALDAIWARGGEGIMLKNVYGTYRPGKRSSDWLKIKEVQTADGIITGFNPGEGKYSDTVGSIIISQYGVRGFEDKPIPVTNISGMTDDMRYSLGPEHLGQVVEFAYQLRTKDSYRHPRFKRFRPDKDPKECIWNG